MSWLVTDWWITVPIAGWLLMATAVAVCWPTDEVSMDDRVKRKVALFLAAVRGEIRFGEAYEKMEAIREEARRSYAKQYWTAWFKGLIPYYWFKMFLGTLGK